jgi:hypothetical protein
MEALVFGLIALVALNKKQERSVPEPAEFQPFDLRSLGHLYDAKDDSPSRISDRERPYVAQTLSCRYRHEPPLLIQFSQAPPCRILLAGLRARSNNCVGSTRPRSTRYCQGHQV